MSGAPWVLISHGRLDAEYTKQSLYDVTEKRCYHADPDPHLEPFLNEKRVIGSTSHGWLVLSHFWEDDWWLWNPNSGSRIQLPRLQHTRFFNTAVLTKPPTDPDCHVILATKRSNMMAYCRIGDDVFKTQDMYMLTMISSSRGGRIYGVGIISDNIQLVSIEFVDEELMVRPIFKLKGSIKNDHIENIHLVESESESESEELLLVYYIQPSLKISRYRFRVYRVNLTARECVKLDSIGDRTLFVADSGDSFCCSAAANKTKPNSIYFARNNFRNLYIYELDDMRRRITKFLPSPAIHRYEPYPSWIKQQPSHHLLTTYFRQYQTTN